MPNRPLHHAPEHSAGGVEVDGRTAASTVCETQPRARAKAAFFEFWNTGDEALLKRALAENFADHTLD